MKPRTIYARDGYPSRSEGLNGFYRIASEMLLAEGEELDSKLLFVSHRNLAHSSVLRSGLIDCAQPEDVRFWHLATVPTHSLNVRYWG
jgi:hypothetical protein